MTRATFFKHFELLADQPDAVAKMRELVLELAVRGKLVAQNPKDESAEILLSKVHAAKERLTKELRIKKLAADLPIKDEDKNRALPTGWAWAKLADLCIKLGAGSTPLGGKQVYETSGVKFLRSQNVYNDGLHLDDVAFIPPAIHKDMSGTWVQPGDVLLNITGASIGRSAIVPDNFDEANVSQHVAIVRLAEKAIRQFLHLVIIAPDFQQRIMDVQVGVSREGLSMTRLKEFVVTLPPLAEQRRIVAKVDELMALCDELEQRQQARQHASGLLQQSALHHLLAAREPQTFAAAWQRTRDHCHLLHDPPDSIPQLRHAILQLAVQGRLVPQNPKDEPAFKLVERIAANHAVSVRKGASKLGRQFATLKTEEAPFLIPPTWAWAKLGHLRDAKSPITYGVLVPGPEVDDGIPFVRLQDLSVTNPAAKPNKSISPEIEAAYSRTRLRGGEILLGVVGSIGKIGVAPPSWAGANIARAVSRIVPDANVLRDYLVLVLQSAYFQNYLRETTRTLAQPTLNIGQLEIAPVPIPPLAEQKRIVARVEELLRWCDTLEAQLHQTRTLGAHLLASTHHHLLAA